ncbi:MAG: alanyl-tRNA editing protein [Candidatus Heimdallarchaeota archaeon]|nr:alanyl-tRNA editing protein [Candidatus Heimdallarchaeota archaeon]
MNQETSNPIYWDSPYQKEIKAKITNIRDSKLQFDQTIFYPGGGGQLHDRGYIIYQTTEFPVSEVFKEDDGYWHKIKMDKKIPLKIGEEVLLKLDWERRYSFMRAHSSQHLLTHVLIKRYRCQTTKANFEIGRVEIEVDKRLKLSEIVDAFREVNRMLHQGDEVVSIIVNQETYSSEYKSKIRGKTSDEKTIRLIQLGSEEGYDLVGCGGIHVKNLSEIKGIVLDTVKGNLIKYFVDELAFDFANQQRELMINLEEITEKKDKKLIELISNKLKNAETLIQGNVKLLKMIFENTKIWSEEINGKQVTLLELEQLDRQIIQSSAKELENNAFLGLLGSNDILYLLSTIESLPANEVVSAFGSKTDAKGGGSKAFAQVSVKNIENPFSVLKEIIKEF